MQASVIVVNWRQPELTLRCLDALSRQATTRPFEVVLVENESAPGSVAPFRRAYPEAVIVENPLNSGFAGGVTAGIAVATGEVIVLVNNDAVPDADFLEAGLDALDRAADDVAAASATVVLEGRFVRVDEGDEDTLRGLDGAVWRRARAGEAGVELLNGTGISVTADANGHDRGWLRPVTEPPVAGDPFGFSGGAAFLRRAPLETVGGFDESLFMYYEDLDVSWRLRLAGHRIVHAAEARVVHRHAASSSSSGELVRRQSMRNRLAVVIRNGSARLVVRVACRTALRLLRDAMHPRRAYLSREAWIRILHDLPSLVAGSIRARRAAVVSRSQRAAVERLFG